MRIRVNGDVRDLPESLTISELLDSLKLRRDGIAVELNKEIVPKVRHAETALKDGDALEIVTFVGGG